MNTRLIRFISAVATTIFAVGACSSGDDGGTQPVTRQLATVSGSPQEGFVSTALQEPLIVRVTEGQNPVSGVQIQWQVTGGGGSVSPATSTTGANGNAQTTFTLGPAAGTHTATASASGVSGSPRTFSAQAFLGRMALADGDDQQARTGSALQDPLRVLITSGAGAAIAGVTVSWSVASGGGSVNPTSSQTDATGFASTTFTLGAGGGNQSAVATAAGYVGSPVSFGATAVATTAAVDVGDIFFDPTNATIATGGAVTWTWVGSLDHRVMFDDASILPSDTQASGSISRTFASAGTFTYYCTVHGRAAMSGEVSVVAVP